MHYVAPEVLANYKRSVYDGMKVRGNRRVSASGGPSLEHQPREPRAAATSSRWRSSCLHYGRRAAGRLPSLLANCCLCCGAHAVPQADVWSCGVLLYVTLFCTFPFAVEAAGGGPAAEAQQMHEVGMSRAGDCCELARKKRRWHALAELMRGSQQRLPC